MQGKAKRIVAALIGVAMVTAPVSAWADDYCATYHQVESHATGGDYVGGILSYSTMGSVSRSDGGSQVAIGVSAGGITTTVTMTQPPNVTTTQEPIGIYNMNDGTVWEVNCLTGAARKIS